MLAHFLSFPVIDVTEDYYILKGRFVKQERRYCKQRVEPSPGLVYRFAYKVGRIMLLKHLFVLERVMPLCERHRSGIEPAVYYLRHPLHESGAFRTLEIDLVYERFMQFYVVRHIFAHFLQFDYAPNQMTVSASTLPDRQRSAPVSRTAKAPVHYIFKEVAHTSFPYIVRQPVYAVVVFEQLVPYRRHLYEPCIRCIVKQRRVASPAERI